MVQGHAGEARVGSTMIVPPLDHIFDIIKPLNPRREVRVQLIYWTCMPGNRREIVKYIGVIGLRRAC